MIISKTDALEQIKDGLQCSQFLEKSKGSSMYVCPFCGSGTGRNGTGALKIYPTNTWYCHACNEKGDVLDLIQKVYGLNFNDALEKAADMMGIQYDHGTALDGARMNFKNKGVLKSAEGQETQNRADYTTYYEACRERLSDPAAISYLKARGISPELAELAGLGFDPEADPASAPGAMPGAKKLHPVPRIIIPTAKAHYVGRSIDPNTEKVYRKMNPKKNMGAGEPGIFNAGTIYGKGIWQKRRNKDGAEYRSQRQPGEPVFVVEGAFDALSIYEVGQHAIALNSTSNTEKLIDVLQETPAATDTAFIVAFDNDTDEKTAERTRAAAEGLTKSLNALGYKTITADIAGQYNDANDALQNDREGFRAMVDAAVKEASRDYLDDFLDKIQTEAYKPHETGLKFFDNMMCGGIEDQQLIVLMAAPGTGKTTLCQQLAEEMAANHKPVIYMNLEMSREQMLSKAISYHLAKSGKAWLSSRDVLHGYEWEPERKQLMIEAMQEYREKYYPWIKYATVGNKLEDIIPYLEKAGKAAIERGEKAPAVILDYLHLVGTSAKMDVQELLKTTLKGLKDYAIKYNTFVVAISATGRSSNGKITLSSGRDSSNIEYTGDVVLSLDFYLVDTGKVHTDNAKEMATLTDGVKWRQMILRVLKGRYFAAGGKARLWYNATSNFYLGENDLITGDLIKGDWNTGDIASELPAFEKESKASKPRI